MELTTNAEDDAVVAGRMLKDNVGKLNSFRGNGGYDDFSFREILGSQVKQIIEMVQKIGTKKLLNSSKL